MAIIDLNFEGEEEATPTPETAQPEAAEPQGLIDLQFEGEEGRETLDTGVSGYAEPVEQNILEKIGGWYNQGYAEARKNIAQQKGLAFDETAEDKARTGARVKELERESEKYGMELDTMRQLQQISEADSLTDAVVLMARYPESVAAVTVSSLGRFAPTLAAVAGVGTMTGGATLPMMGTTFVGSLAIEYGAVMDEEIRANGYDSADPLAWQKAVSDEGMLANARERGLKRGIPIAAFDALSMGIAGKLLAGAKPTATSIVGRGTAELGVQSTLGGMGEAAGQYVETGEVGAPGEVAMEAAAEIAPGFAETLIGYKGEKAQALRRQMAEQAGYEAAQRVADDKLTPDFEVHPLEENETAIDEALAAAPPTPEVRPDEESVTEKFQLEQEAEEVQPDLDMEQLDAEQEANAFVLEQLRAQFPDASEGELLAAIEVYKPAREKLPSEEDLGWAAPEEQKPAAATAAVTPKPEQPQEELPAAEPEEEVQEITRDEVVQATEAVEPSGDALQTAETIRTARPEFADTIFSFAPGTERNGEPMEHYYGEIANTEDADGDPVDVMWNKDFDPESLDGPVYIINQLDPDTQEFRQHKVLGGFDEMNEAETAYINQWGEDSWGSTHELTSEEFQQWRDAGDFKNPYVELVGAAQRTPEVVQSGMRVAARTEEGEVIDTVDGKSVQVHAHLLQGENMQKLGEGNVEMGFVDAEGNFYTREEAIAQLDAEPDTTAVVEPETPVEQTQIEETEQQRKDRISVERQERGKKAAEERRQVQETDDLVDFIRKSGGLNVEMQSDVPGHRLAHLNDRRGIGIPNLVQKGEKGKSLAWLTEAAWEAGYITENDTQQMIDALYESESKSVYTPKGYEAEAQRQADEEYEAQMDAESQAEAQEWADYVNEVDAYNQVDPETARLMKLAEDIDHDTMVDIASQPIDEVEVQAALQAFIDEQKSTKAETASTVKPAEEAGPADAVEQAPAEEQTDFVGKTDEEQAQQAIVDAKAEKESQIPTERPAEAQSGDDLFAAGGQLEPDLFAAEAAPQTVEEWLTAIESTIIERYKKPKKYDGWRDALERSEEMHPTYYEDYRDPELVERGFMAGYMYGIDRGATMSASPQAGVDLADKIGLTEAGRWAPYFSDAHYLGQLAATNATIPAETAPAAAPTPEQAWPQPNKHGVYSDENALILEFPALKKDKIKAGLKLLQIGPDRWAYGYNFQSQQGSGAGQSSGIGAPDVFPTQREAEIAGLRRAKRYGMENSRDTGNSVATDAQRASSRKVMEWAMSELASREATADINDVLFRSTEPREGYKDLNRLQLTAEADGEQVKQSARNWVRDVDNRLERLEQLRTCG